MIELSPFEARLQDALGRLTADGGGQVDAVALARVITAGGRARGSRRLVDRPGDLVRAPRLALLVVAGLLVTILVGAALIGGRFVGPVMPSVPPATTIPSPTAGRAGLIAYCRGESPNATIHLMNADGTGDRELVAGTGAAFAADGSMLTYVTGWPDDTAVFVADPDGSNARSVPDLGGSGGGQERALSPDGTRFAWFDRRVPDGAGGFRTGSIFGFEHPSIWITPLDGGPARRLAASTDVGDPYATALSWSPDGRSLAFAGMAALGNGAYRKAIHVVDVVTGEVRVLTERPDTDSPDIAWSPDSRRIAFTALPDGVGPPTPGIDDELVRDVFVIDADGTGERDLTNRTGDERGPSWSPDGTRLAYVTLDGSTLRTTVLEVDGSPTAAPVTGPVAEWAIWSPDGTRILYLDAGTLSVIDASLQGIPVTMADGATLCAGWDQSWQRLDP